MSVSRDLISKKTRREFQEYFVGVTLREIENEFDAADVPFDETHEPNVQGQRRSLVQQYYHAVDFSNWHDVQKLLIVFENVLMQLESNPEQEIGWDNSNTAGNQFNLLKKWLERDGYKYENGRLFSIGKGAQIPAITNVATRFNAPELHRQIARMRNAVEDDPSLAIGTAKELLETTCKTILSERGIVFDKDWSVMRLVKETRKALELLPEDVPDSAKGADSIRKLLGNLAVVAQGLAELRNLYGTGHGKEGSVKGLKPRHARLAVGSAATLATFLFETHEERQEAF